MSAALGDGLHGDVDDWVKSLREAAYGDSDESIEKLQLLIHGMVSMPTSLLSKLSATCKHVIDVESCSYCAPQLGVRSLQCIASSNVALPATETKWWNNLVYHWISHNYLDHASCILTVMQSRADLQDALDQPTFEMFLLLALLKDNFQAADMVVQCPNFSAMQVPVPWLLNACSAPAGFRRAEWLLSLPQPQRPDSSFEQETPLRLACQENNADIVRLLLSLEAPYAVDVHADEEGPARCAADAGAAQCLQLLLELQGERQVDVNARNGSLWLSACSVEDGDAECMQLLLALPQARGLDVHARGDAALMWAIEAHSTDSVRVLLSLQGEWAMDVHVEQEGPFLKSIQVNDRALAEALLLRFKLPVQEGDTTQTAQTVQSFLCGVLLARTRHLLGNWQPWCGEVLGALLCSGTVSRCGQQLCDAIAKAITQLTVEQRATAHSCTGRHAWAVGGGELARMPRGPMVLRRTATQAAGYETAKHNTYMLCVNSMLGFARNYPWVRFDASGAK